jgi:hypothetical protein
MTDVLDGQIPSPDSSDSYVCWIDIMGTGNHMYRDISVAAQKILNFQVLAKKFESDNLTIYPMMDGVYIVSESVEEVNYPTLLALTRSLRVGLPASTTRFVGTTTVPAGSAVSAGLIDGMCSPATSCLPSPPSLEEIQMKRWGGCVLLRPAVSPTLS